MADAATPNRTFREILAPFRSVRRGIVATTVLSASAALLEAAGLVMVVGLTNAIAQDEERLAQQLGPVTLDLTRSQMVVAALVVIIASAVVTLSANAIRTRITVSWVRTRRRELVRAFLETDWQVQAADKSGRLQAVSQYVDQSALVLSSIIMTGRGLSGVLVLLGTAMIVSPVAAVAILVLGGLLFAVLRPLTLRTRKANREVAMLNRGYLEDLGEISELARDVRVFGVSERFRDRSAASIENLASSEARVYALSWALTPIYQSMALCLIVAILAGAAASSSIGLTTIGAVALLVLRSVAYGQQFQTSYHGIQTYAPALELLADSMDEFLENRPLQGERTSDRIDTVALEHVSFSYPDETVGLVDVDLSFRRGEVVGIVGPSGAGKSTLAQVLLGLRVPAEGRALADGVPFTDYTLESWTRAVSLVPQEIHLAEGSVYDNICFFRPDVDAEAVRDAARAAAIHDTIEALEDGYDTNVGRASRNLSGGQVQRIGIARALAGKPSVLVLDEPTSALDNQSEAAVQQALGALRGNVLVLIIAHRLTTLSVCDRIIVMNGGTVEADGTLEEARAKSAFFRTALLHGTDEVLDEEPDGEPADPLA